jgi:hypothetical protein
MPYDPNRRIQTPDFYPAEQQGWVNMGDDDPVNMQPAASALKQKFTQRPNAGDMTNMPVNNDMPMDMGGADAGGGGAAGLGGKLKGGLKSL